MTMLAAAAVVSTALVLVDTVPAQAATRVCTGYTEALAYTDSGVRYWVRRPTVGFNTWDHNCTLRVGDNAPGAIRALQAAIRCSDGGIVGIDGDFGRQTRQGVINVQTNRHVGVDGIYGPQTVAAVEALQSAAGLPQTGTMDKATEAALRAQLEAAGGAAAQASLASTAALQQTLKLAGYWDGPVDGAWTPALSAALREFQTELGVEPTGAVDAATISALEKAIAEAPAEAPTSAASATPTASPSPSPE